MTQLKIAGMTCDACAAHVKKALENVPGVRWAEVSYAQGNARVAVDAGATPEALIAAVSGAGYRAMPVPDDAAHGAREQTGAG